jgi:catechol 2,3-dioxygenase-like lactoylglutathione lyase family enzyme
MTDSELSGLLEISIYYGESQTDAVHELYEGTLGLRRVASWSDGTALRLGSAIVLLFCHQRLAERDEPISAHGAHGPGHVCFTAPQGGYDEWRRRIAEGPGVVHDQEWPNGGRSFYFRDPAGNLLEIADSDLWPA